MSSTKNPHTARATRLLAFAEKSTGSNRFTNFIGAAYAFNDASALELERGNAALAAELKAKARAAAA